MPGELAATTGWCGQCAQSPVPVVSVEIPGWGVNFTICVNCAQKLHDRARIALSFAVPVIDPKRRF